MTIRGRTLALALAAAVVLASGAYALGSQAGDGSATAAGDKAEKGTDRQGIDPGDGGPPMFFGGPDHVRFRAGAGPGGPPKIERRVFGLDRLADRLGVKEADLAKAMRELRKENAPKLMRDDFVQSLADELGIDESKLEDALEKVGEKQRQAFEQRHDEFLQKLADKLGISKDKVEDALPDLPPGPPGHPRHP